VRRVEIIPEVRDRDLLERIQGIKTEHPPLSPEKTG